MKTGFLGTPTVAELRAYAEFADQINPPHATIYAEYVDAVHGVKGPHGRPLEVFTWTVNDADDRAARSPGAAWTASSPTSPDVVRDALRRRPLTAG